jgi:hypothetical protein
MLFHVLLNCKEVIPAMLATLKIAVQIALTGEQRLELFILLPV